MEAAPQPARLAVGRRWLGVGRAGGPDGRQAGARAARAALQGDDVALALVFAAEGLDLEAVGAGVAQAGAPDAVVGCATGEPIPSAAEATESVVVVALGGEGFTASTAVVDVAAAGGLREAGAQAAACLGDVGDRPHQALLLLTDPLAGDQQQVVRGAYSVVGAGVPLVGGGVGGRGATGPGQLHGRDVHGACVLAAAIGSDAPLGVGLSHGCEPAGDPLLVTRADGRRVLELDGRPALDAYLDRVGAGVDGTPDHAALLALATRHPLGLARRSGEPSVRGVADVDVDERSLSFLSEIPNGGLVWTLTCTAEGAARATEVACQEALAGLAGAPPLGLLAFGSPARRVVLGPDGLRRARERLATHAGGAPLAGLSARGQIARTRGLAGFHQHTLVVLALA